MEALEKLYSAPKWSSKKFSSHQIENTALTVRPLTVPELSKRVTEAYKNILGLEAGCPPGNRAAQWGKHALLTPGGNLFSFIPSRDW